MASHAFGFSIYSRMAIWGISVSLDWRLQHKSHVVVCPSQRTSTPKDRQISIPQQTYQPQAQVRHIRNQRQRHEQNHQKRQRGTEELRDGALEAQAAEKQVEA